MSSDCSRVGMSCKLAWVLKDVLPPLVDDARISEREHGEIAEQMNQLGEKKLKLGERLEALGGSIRDLAIFAKLLGCTEEQLAQVVGEQLAHDVFRVVEF